MSNNTIKSQQLIAEGKLEKASRLLEKQCKKKPKNPEVRMSLALLYAQMALFDKSEACLKIMLGLKLDTRLSVKGNNTLAFLLVQKKDYSQAIPLYQTSLNLNAKQVSIYFNLAGCLKEERRTDEAIDAYLCSLELNPEQYLACREVAQLYEQVHQLDKSREYAERAIKLSAGDVESEFLIAKLDARGRQYSLAKQGLQNLLDKSLAPRHRAVISLELGMILDKLGEYDDAFEIINDGNNRLEALYKPQQNESDVDKYRFELEQYKGAYNLNGIDTWSDISQISEPLKLIFLMGFPRSGTTLTEQVLESHEDVVATHELPALPRLIRNIDVTIGSKFKYPDDVSTLDKKDISLLRSAYIDEMEGLLNNKLDKSKYLLDKLPLNIIYIDFISRVFPDAKLLVAIRDPRDVCLSCFMQLFKVNQAMRQFLTIKDTAKFYKTVMSNYLFFKDTAKLNVLETRYEDIVDDLEESAKRLLDFIGVEWDSRVLNFYESAKNRVVHTPSYQGVIQPVYKGSIAKWKNYSTKVFPEFNELDKFIKCFDYEKM